jgi:Sulfotransferase domain
MNGLETENFERALSLEEARERDIAPHLRFSRPHANFSRGLYAKHLSRFFRYFPREQILVLRIEDVKAQADGVARKFFEFVGVNPVAGLTEGLIGVNSARIEKDPPLDPVIRTQLVQRYQEPNRQLQALLEFPLWHEN